MEGGGAGVTMVTVRGGGKGRGEFTILWCQTVYHLMTSKTQTHTHTHPSTRYWKATHTLWRTPSGPVCVFQSSDLNQADKRLITVIKLSLINNLSLFINLSLINNVSQSRDVCWGWAEKFNSSVLLSSTLLLLSDPCVPLFCCFCLILVFYCSVASVWSLCSPVLLLLSDPCVLLFCCLCLILVFSCSVASVWCLSLFQLKFSRGWLTATSVQEVLFWKLTGSSLLLLCVTSCLLSYLFYLKSL